MMVPDHLLLLRAILRKLETSILLGWGLEKAVVQNSFSSFHHWLLFLQPLGIVHPQNISYGISYKS